MTQAPDQTIPAAEAPRITIPPAVVVSDLAGLLGITPVDTIKELMKNGVMATINQVVDFDTAAVVAADLGYAPEEEGAEETVALAGEAEAATLSRRIIEEGADAQRQFLDERRCALAGADESPSR